MGGRSIWSEFFGKCGERGEVMAGLGRRRRQESSSGH